MPGITLILPTPLLDHRETDEGHRQNIQLFLAVGSLLNTCLASVAIYATLAMIVDQG